MKDCVDPTKFINVLSNLVLLFVEGVLLKPLFLTVLSTGVDLLLKLSEDVLESPELIMALLVLILLVLVLPVGISRVPCVLTILPVLPVRSYSLFLSPSLSTS